MPNLTEAVIAANRFGFGATPGALRAIAGDPRGWVKSQFGADAPLPAQVAALPAGEDDLLAFGRWLAARRLRTEDAGRMASPTQPMTMQEEQRLSIEQDFIRNFRDRVTMAVAARLEAAMSSPTPARERAVHFWSNHFTVSTTKPAAVALPPSFEREAIRPRVSGHFEDLLLASTKHPGMLVYLDNWNSIGPHSLMAHQAPAQRRALGLRGASGLNENLGRELLELHTLGVDSGYTQADVQALAAIITGWSFDRPPLRAFIDDSVGRRSGEQMFQFVGDAHEPGAKTLLGKVYRDGGVGQGEQALRDLARHPSTARFIATKLTRHYIADAPPPAAVERVAGVFKATQGDLRRTMHAVVDCPETWATPFAKFKQPEEYAISVMRAVGATSVSPLGAYGALAGMGQKVYGAPGPDGWPDRAENWLSGDLVWKRLEYAQRYAQGVARADIDPVAVGEDVLGPLLSSDTRDAVARAESPAQGLALLFASPEFQRR